MREKNSIFTKLTFEIVLPKDIQDVPKLTF